MEININQDGNLPVVPYTVSLENENKYLSVCGTLHSTSPLDPMFESLEQTYNKIKPVKILTEDKPQYQFYTSRNASIVLDGETGFVRFLGNMTRVKPEHLHIDPMAEIAAMLEEYPREEVFVYLVCDRFLSSRNSPSESSYADFVQKYLVRNGFLLQLEERKFKFFEDCFQKVMNRKFIFKELLPDDYSPIRNNGKLCELARFSYKYKDNILLERIEQLIKKHDRVQVVFSGWHVLSIEPALIKIFNSLKTSS